MLFNRIPQLPQRLLIKHIPRLVRILIDHLNRQKHHPVAHHPTAVSHPLNRNPLIRHFVKLRNHLNRTNHINRRNHTDRRNHIDGGNHLDRVNHINWGCPISRVLCEKWGLRSHQRLVWVGHSCPTRLQLR